MIDHDQMLAIQADEISDASKLCRQPAVSVLMLAYNHSHYIEQAVESVMAQQCDFEFEILIGEDHSTDDTRAICEALQQKHPGHIRLIVAERNVGITANFLRLVSRARGKYSAFLEGDDYWTVPDKLQLQVDLMEAHPEYAWCGGRTENRLVWAKKKPAYLLEDILRRYIVHTSAVLFRTHLLARYPRFPELVCLDNLLFAYLSQFGPCGFIDRELSYYRRHDVGVWSGAGIDKRLQMTRDCIDALDAYFGGRYRKALIDRELWIYRMDTHIHLGRELLQRWRQSLSVVGAVFSRMIRRAPAGMLILAFEVLVQPLTAVYLLLRRKLGLGRYLRAVRHWYAGGKSAS